MDTASWFRRLKTATALTPVLLIGLGTALPAAANPLDGKVVAGEAAISNPDPKTLRVDQTTDKAIVEWKSFNIETGETTVFVQPSSNSWTLNRVVGSQDPSRIYGTLRANGNIVIVNPDGIHFGAGSSVDVNRLIATTHDIKNNNFTSGSFVFDQSGSPTASIVNEGSISIADYGLAALVAPSVRNAGVISARLGHISLASGNQFTIDPFGDGLVKLAIDDAIEAEVIDVATGKPVSDLVKNEGTLQAGGGVVALSAATASRAVNAVINNTGVIEANSIGMRGGKIILSAQTAGTKRTAAPNQIVRVSGQLSAMSVDDIPIPTAAPRGHIEITGESIFATAATINASGTYGGGTVLIGGDYMGGNPDPATVAEYDISLESQTVPTARIVTLDDATRISADAVTDGDGGKVIVWSDEATITAAEITARGGANAGNGGFIETSGKFLSALRAADASAPNGTAGTWLLDPLDTHIRNAANANFATLVQTLIPGVIGDSTFPTASPSVISTTNVEAALNSGTNVRVTTRSTTGGEPGDIYVEDSITKSAGGDVFANINAAGSVYFSPGVNLISTSGKVVFHVYATDGEIRGNNIGQIDVNGGQFLVEARDGIVISSNHDMPDNMTVSLRSGTSGNNPVIVSLRFDDDSINLTHNNSIIKLGDGPAIQLKDSTSDSNLQFDFDDFDVELDNNAILVSGDRDITFRLFGNQSFGPSATVKGDAIPEISSGGSIILQYDTAGLPLVTPTVQVDTTNTPTCLGLKCTFVDDGAETPSDEINSEILNPDPEAGTLTNLDVENPPNLDLNDLLATILVDVTLDEISITNINRITDLLSFFLESEIAGTTLLKAFSSTDDFVIFSRSYLGQAAANGLLRKVGLGIALDISEELILAYVEHTHGRWSSTYTSVVTSWDLFVLARAATGDIGAQISIPIRTSTRLVEVIKTTKEIYESGVVGELSELENEVYRLGEVYVKALESNSYNGQPLGDNARTAMIEYIQNIPNATRELADARQNPLLIAADTAGKIIDNIQGKISGIFN